MLQIDKVQTIDGVTVYGDSELAHRFYLVPDTPRFRLDERGTPVLRFVKYRFPVDREDGKKGGGFCFFDVEFTVPAEKEASIREKLQAQVNRRHRRGDPPEVEIGTITYTKGEARLLLQADDGVLIERVSNPAKPSLFGRNITPFALELSPEGATLFWEAMQGKGGVVQVVYDLHFLAALPPVNIRGGFRAEAFYSFYQTIDVDWHAWREDDYRETLREQVRNSDSLWIQPDFGALTDEKLKAELRQWAFRTIEEAAERRMIEAIAPVPEEGRKLPENIENVTRDLSVRKISSFTLTFREKQAVAWNLAPQGTLPNITNLTDGEGKPVRWEDHAREIDLNDPFFQQINVSVRVNADFERLPIDSVEVKLDYHQGSTHELKELLFEKADDVGSFASFIEDDERSYTYSYQVNYRGEGRSFQSEPAETDEQVLTINVGDLGIIDVDVIAGDLRFGQVKQAQVTLRYEDGAVGPIERQLTLDDKNRERRFQAVIFEAQRRPYRYKVRYSMADGRELEADWAESWSPQLPIHDPFGATRTIGVRTLGDLEGDIQTIFLDLEYVDEANAYRQSRSIALNRDNPFFDWDFPVIDESAGRVTYSGTIQFRDGTSEPIPETEPRQGTILVGKAVSGFLEVQVTPQLLDFSEVRLAQVMLRYDDPENDVHAAKDLVFSQRQADMQTWKVELKARDHGQYRWQAIYFLADGTRRQTEWQDTDARTLVLDAQAA